MTLPTTNELQELLAYLTPQELGELEKYLTPSREEAKEQAEQSLSAFIRQAWTVVEPATNYVEGWHIDCMCEHLEAVTRRQIRNLIINVPPGHMKSLTTVVMWPSWEWGPRNLAHYRYLTASYSSDLSERDNNKARLLMNSDWYRQNWGDRVRLTKQGDKRIENRATGFRVASSVGGLGTGARVHRAIMDDLLRANDAHSEAIRKRAIEHVKAMATRGVNPTEYSQVLIMQRLHEEDPTGYIIDNLSDHWEHLSLPAEFERRRKIFIGGAHKEIDVKETPTSIGWIDPREEEGELLWPVQFPAAELAIIKKSLGSYGAAGQLQQRPTPDEGGIFKRVWWKFYTVRPGRFDEVIQSWDCSFKALDESDYVAGQVWGRIGAHKYLLYRLKEKMDMPATVQAIRLVSYNYPEAHAKLVEDKANGPAVISTLQHEIPGLIAVNPEGGKIARAHAVSPDVEAGNVWLPDPSIAPWVLDFIEEVSVFPNAAHDDEVDAMTQALNRLKSGGQFSFGTI